MSLDKAENLMAELTGRSNDLVDFSVDDLTAQIVLLKHQTACNIFEMGRRLQEVQDRLPHGEWLNWLKSKVEFSERTAQRFMKVARECGNTTALSHLGPTKVFLLLDLPVEERESFATQPHVLPSGETKTIDEMTSREMERVLREKREADEAVRLAEEARLRAVADRDLADQATNEARELVEEKNETIKRLQKQLEDRPEKEKPPADYALIKNANKVLEGQLAQAKSTISTLQDEIKASSTGQVDDRISVQLRVKIFANIVKEFIDKVAPLGYLSADHLRTSPDSLKQYESIISTVEKWCADMRGQIVAPKKGDIIDAEVIS